MGAMRLIGVLAIGLLLTAPVSVGAGGRPKKGGAALGPLSAEWVQWALSIPTGLNPQLGDYTDGDQCVVGQTGDVWFLAGVFGGGEAHRTCVIPQGTKLFFPIANYFEFNSPGVCGSPAVTVAQMRANGQDFVDALTSFSLTVDGQPETVRRVQSPVFGVALPEDNIFDPLCAPENVPGGIYSPAITDGIYALVNPLPVGSHEIHFAAEAIGGGFTDVTYTIEVVPLVLH
jgi:hypothetical protein